MSTKSSEDRKRQNKKQPHSSVSNLSDLGRFFEGIPEQKKKNGSTTKKKTLIFVVKSTRYSIFRDNFTQICNIPPIGPDDALLAAVVLTSPWAEPRALQFRGVGACDQRDGSSARVRHVAAPIFQRYFLEWTRLPLRHQRHDADVLFFDQIAPQLAEHLCGI